MWKYLFIGGLTVLALFAAFWLFVLGGFGAIVYGMGKTPVGTPAAAEHTAAGALIVPVAEISDPLEIRSCPGPALFPSEQRPEMVRVLEIGTCGGTERFGSLAAGDKLELTGELKGTWLITAATELPAVAEDTDLPVAPLLIQTWLADSQLVLSLEPSA